MTIVLNRKMTNKELMAIDAVKQSLENGDLVIIDKVPTANPDFVNMYFFGNVEGLGNNTVNDVQAMFLGWSNSTFQQRCIQNAALEVADTYEIGDPISNVGIQIKDSLTPEFEGHTPRKDGDGNILLHQGNPIFRTTIINSKEVIAEEGHFTLKVTSREGEEEPEAPKGVNASSLLKKEPQV